MAFVIKKRIELAWAGEGWEEAFVEFSDFSYKDNSRLLKLRKKARQVEGGKAKDEEVDKLSEDMMAIVLSKFLSGKGFDGERLVDITKSNFPELPFSIINHIITELQKGIVSPNSKALSGK